MGSETIAFDIWLVILCINAGLLLVDATFDTPLKTPFSGANVTAITTGTPAQIYNETTGTGLTQNLTNQNLNNATIGGSGGGINPLDTLFFPLVAIWTFIQFVTGGFVFQVIELFGFPSAFVFGLQGIVGILFARMIIYFIVGR